MYKKTLALVGLTMPLQSYAMVVSDSNLYSGITDNHIYSFDLGDIDESGFASLDIRLGGWSGVIPVSGPRVTGDVAVNGIKIKNFGIFDSFFSTPDPSDTYNLTGFLQDGVNTFEFDAIFIAPNYESYAISNFALTYASQVPIPSAAWLFGSALAGMIGLRTRSIN